MKILALEFSSPRRSVAVLDAGPNGARLASGSAAEAGGRSTRAFGLIESALRDAGLEREQIECIAIGLGPGSYTGIRAALALAQGWELAGAVRLLGVSSVECLAADVHEAGGSGRVHIVIDAQRNEFYLATYELTADGACEVEALRLADLAEVRARLARGEKLAGPEVSRWFPGQADVFPEAATLARLAAARSDFVPGEKLEPIYLREANFVKAPAPRAWPPL